MTAQILWNERIDGIKYERRSAAQIVYDDMVEDEIPLDTQEEWHSMLSPPPPARDFLH